MDQIQDVLELIRLKGLAKGRLRGVFHIAIGRKLARPDGAAISTGVTWRELAAILRDLRFDPEIVRELDVEPDTLAPRDRFKFWYSAIGLAKVDSPAAFTEAEKLAAALKPLGVIVGPPPSMASGATKPAAPMVPVEEGPKPEKKAGKKKK